MMVDEILYKSTDGSFSKSTACRGANLYLVCLFQYEQNVSPFTMEEARQLADDSGEQCCIKSSVLVSAWIQGHLAAEVARLRLLSFRSVSF